MAKNATTNNTAVATENSPDANGRVGLLTFKRLSETLNNKHNNVIDSKHD